MAPKPKVQPFTIENARLIFRNFRGEQSQFNRAGDRNFAVIIDDDRLAAQLSADGWNVKVREPREEGDEPFNYLSVKVSFTGRPPTIVRIGGTSKTRVRITEDTVEMLDYDSFELVDLTINPYEYDVSGSQGISAYLKTMYVTVEEDSLDAKYAIDEP